MDYYGKIAFEEGIVLKKIIPVLIILVVTVVLVNVFIGDENVTKPINVKEERSERWDHIAAVLNNGFDEFGLFSFQADVEESIIWIEMDDTKSELLLKKYLRENVYKSDLKHFNFEITKRNRQEIEEEMFMSKVSDIVSDYIKEKDYKDVSIQHPTVEPEPLLTITISENSEISSEVLKKELEDLLVTKNTELPKKDVSYEIQVIKG